jgi:hypothetical protein
MGILKGIGIGVAVLIGIGMLVDKTGTSTDRAGATSGPSASQMKRQALGLVKINEWSWDTHGFGNVMMANFTFENRNAFSVKDIEVTCTHIANSGTKIDSNTRTIYEIIPGNGLRSVRDFNMGFVNSQAAKSRCEVTNLVVLQ